MNSLRPLVTITILAVIGAWLYVKINEGPGRPVHGDAEAWPDQSSEGVPPLSATSAPLGEAEAPTWPTGVGTSPAAAAAAPPTPVALQPAPVAVQPAAAMNGGGAGEMPPIPELPDAASPDDAAPATASAATTTAPAAIPTARYPADESAANTLADESPARAAVDAVAAVKSGPDSDRGGPATTGLVAASSAADRYVSSAAAPPTAAGSAGSIPPAQAALPSATTAAAADLREPPTQEAAPTADRHGLANVNPLEPAPPSPASLPVEPTFADAWPEIQSALDRRELARAHQLLSGWYGDSSLTPAEAEKVDLLLGQLAGTVVYSTEHQLEPAYVVRPGDTLETIAAQYNVPWQLLAKINGVPTVSAVQPGQQLKVVRGPFSAVVDLSRSQLTLLVDGRYAGRFPIVVPSGTMLTDGQWLVDQKLAVPAASGAPSSYETASAQAAVDRAIVLKGEDAATGRPAVAGPTITIASNPPSIGAAGSAPAIRVSPQDAEELSDILSIGSRVTVRR